MVDAAGDAGHGDEEADSRAAAEVVGAAMHPREGQGMGEGGGEIHPSGHHRAGRSSEVVERE